MAVPLFRAMFEEELQTLAVQLATLEPLERDNFTLLKSQYIAIKTLYGLFEGAIQQGDEARDRLAGVKDKTGIL
jgi:hypothetical protein